MQLHICQNGQQTGPFPIETVQQMMQAGSIPAGTLAWHDGLTDWTPVENLLPRSQNTGLKVTAQPVSHTPAATPQPQVQQFVPLQSAQSQNEPTDVSRVLRAGVAGGVACLVSGGAWAALAIIFNIQLGILAWGIGAFCGWAISRFGQGNGVVFQVMAVICALVGILIGKVGTLIGLGVFPLGFFDILWIFFSVTSAWKAAGDE